MKAKIIISVLLVMSAAVIITVFLNNKFLSEPAENIEEKMPEPAKLEIGAVMCDDKTEFCFTPREFIAAYNGNAENSYEIIDETTDCMKTEGHSPYNGYESDWYIYSADKRISSFPTLSVYTEPGGDSVYEIKLTFIDHDYRENLYEKYKKMCVCALKTVFPNINNGESERLYESLYNSAVNNFRNGGGNDKPAVVYSQNNIGVYGFYKSGTVNICIVPNL